MNCKEFSKVLGEYVNRTLGEMDAECAEVHINACAECSAKARELESTAMLVRSLDRASTPAGFEERLKTRLAMQQRQAPAGLRATIRAWVHAAGRSLWGAPGHRLAFRPALMALFLCAVIAGSVFVVGPNRQANVPDTDWAYIQTCKDQHASFAGANPLGDESAAALRESAGDMDEML